MMGNTGCHRAQQEFLNGAFAFVSQYNQIALNFIGHIENLVADIGGFMEPGRNMREFPTSLHWSGVAGISPPFSSSLSKPSSGVA